MTYFGATLLSAIATVVLAVFAVFTAWYARKAFRKQSQEVAAIEQQVSDQKELTARQADLLKVQSDQLELQRRQFDRDQADRRRAQASSVYFTTDITYGGGDPLDPAPSPSYPQFIRVHVVNSSSLPVYDVAIAWCEDSAPRDDTRTAEGQPTLVVLHPRDTHNLKVEYPGKLPPDVALSRFSAMVRFRDAAGVRWLLRPGGRLTEEPAAL